MAVQSELTELLIRWREGDGAVLDQLAVLVEPDLRKLAGRIFAREPAGHTLQPTALINEVFLRLLRQRKIGFRNRTHFLALAATLMRRVLVDHARKRRAAKRGGDATLVSWTEVDEPAARSESSVDLLALEDALEALEVVSARQSEVVELRFFGGLTVKESARVLGVSPETVKIDWSMARAFLYREIRGA
ncbi:MAG: sigma-70 family RNA polymerase sigma factor [Acidobacteriota bacterium]